VINRELTHQYHAINRHSYMHTHNVYYIYIYIYITHTFFYGMKEKQVQDKKSTRQNGDDSSAGALCIPKTHTHAHTQSITSFARGIQTGARLRSTGQSGQWPPLGQHSLQRLCFEERKNPPWPSLDKVFCPPGQPICLCRFVNNLNLHIFQFLGSCLWTVKQRCKRAERLRYIIPLSLAESFLALTPGRKPHIYFWLMQTVTWIDSGYWSQTLAYRTPIYCCRVMSDAFIITFCVKQNILQ
jgi:hypothetical protein